jgi:hypothetical protein
VISFVEGLWDPSQSQALSAINGPLKATLPAAQIVCSPSPEIPPSRPLCCVFWLNQRLTFAQSVAQTMTAGGYVTDS